MTTRVKISDFGIIQKALALATVTFYETAADGSNSGTKATLYRAATGTDVYPNPQTLTEDGQLSADVYVEEQVLCTITGISERTERGIRKIKQTPTEYQLPVTSATWAKQAGEDLYDDLAAVQAAVDSVEAVLADAGFIAVSGDLLGANTIGTVASSIGNVNTVASDLSGDNNIGAVAADLANIDIVSSSILDVEAVAANIGAVVGVNGNETNINTVSSAITSVQDVATNIAAVVAVSLDLTAINAVYADLTNIDDVHSAIANINLVAADLTNIDLVAADLANIDLAAADLSNIDIVAGISTQITTLAGISADVTAAAANIPKSNRTATADPTVNDDSGDGYSEGSLWVNTTSNQVFFCGDPAAGSAVWVNVTAASTLSSLGDVGFSSLASGDLIRYNGTVWQNRTASQFRTDIGLVIGTDVQAYSSVLANTTASFTTAQETKLGYLTLTGAVNLDSINTRVNALDAAIILMGSWDASSGSFPGGGTAQAGESWIVSVGGTVDGVTFTANDRIIAILDNASTTTFASNWFKADYTDQVLSVAGRTGAVTLAQADISGLTTADSPQLTAINIGHATDTTLGRTSAGLLNVEGKDIVTVSDTQTLTNKTLTAAALGSSTATTQSQRDNSTKVATDAYVDREAGGIIGNAQTISYTGVLADAGKCIEMNGSSLTFTIPANASVAYPTGTVLMVENVNSTSLTIAITSDTLNSTLGSGSRTLAQYGQAFIRKRTSTVWTISGSGLS